MNAPSRLDDYLEAFRTRLKRVWLARGIAVAALVCVLVTIVGAVLAIRAGFASDVVVTARVVLVLLLAAVVLWLVVLPLRRIRRGPAQAIEARTPAFGGRVDTYLGIGDEPNPLRALLAEDTLEVARRFPIERQVRSGEFTVPGVITGVCIGILLWLAVAGPGLMPYGVRHLWAGWAVSGLLPPQTIVVTPGDELVRRGGSLRVHADMQGFDPSRASLHARIGAGDWQEVDMARVAEQFEFTFFSLREPLEYFVLAAGIRSPSFEVSIVDLPTVQNLKVTYRYPEWTGRPPETDDPGGDIRAIAGTAIELEVVTDIPLSAGELVLNGETQAMSIDGEQSRVGFEVTGDGQYFVAARVGADQVRLTSDYFIQRMDDRKPDIMLVRPGRDWRASNIEEVTTQVDATDDYALESVVLRFSVNGGDWQSVPLPFDGRDADVDHVFFLERLSPRAGAGAGATGPDDADARLVPGDLISYYALATDRDQTTRTDMFFIEVQPFERRYQQSQSMGGGAGGQGEWQQEISQRQREIILSTWNLLREQSEARDEADSNVDDNATLLSKLQLTLAEQAQKLADRTRARQLNFADERIASFAENLELAAEAMQPAAERLAAIDLEQAIQPEQEALQHLLRAEAAFTDIQVSFQRGPTGRGFQAGRDLAEMFELEMDLEKNQYETGNPASPHSPSREFDDAMRELDELARRQQELADNMLQRQNLTPAQRWQQEMLRRETEELQQRLENLQRQQQQLSRQTTGQAEPGSSQSELDRRLESAVRAMNEAARSASDEFDRDRLQRSAREAQRQLAGAREQVAEAQRRSMQESFADMSDRASGLHDEQARVAEELQELVERELDAGERGGFDRGLSRDERSELAETKRTMREGLQVLEQDMRAAAEEFRGSASEAARELDDAARELRESGVDTRLTVAADYIENGEAAYIAGSESAVTNALRELRDRLRRAQSVADASDLTGGNDFERALSQTRALREELQRLANGDGGNASQQGGLGDGNAWNWPTQPAVIGNPEFLIGIDQGVNDTARAVRTLIPELRRRSLDPREIDEVRELTRQLELARFDGNAELLQREYSAALALLEQLELRLAQGAQPDGPGKVRTAVAEPIPNEYKDAVAEYYRRLSEE